VFQFSVDRERALSVRFFSRGGSVHGIEANQGLEFRSFARAVVADDRGEWLDHMVAAARSGAAWHHEYRVHAPDGGIAWMEARARPHQRRRLR
jgi:PAS domain-containing protein